MTAAVLVCGSLNIDLVARVATLPRAGETLLSSGLQRLPGGKGLNQAVAAARMNTPTALVGARGNDAEGATLAALLDREGIDTRALLVRDSRLAPDAHTGLAQVWVAADGENVIVVHSGANATLSPAEVRAAFTQTGAGAKVALAQLETPPNTVAAFLQAARAQGASTVLNTAPAVAGTRTLLAGADWVLLNETELLHYATDATASPTQELSLEQCVAMARRLIDTAQQTIVVTLGARGALAVTPQHHAHYAAVPTTVIDTTGAGDCFCGVFAAALAAGWPAAAALERANRAAALAVSRPGAAPAMPRVDELG